MTTKNWLKGWPLLAVALLMVVGAIPTIAADGDSDELTNLINDVGQSYAEGYLAPLISGFGINQNSGLYHTAAIPRTGLSVSFAIKGMASKLDTDDKTFRVSRRVDLSDYLNPGDPGYGDEGVIVFEGPTVFGAEGVKGSMTGYWHGIPVYQEDGIESLVDSDYVPLITPEVSVGGIAGLRGTLRWLPSIDAGEVGKIQYMGYGLSYSASSMFPTLPVDVMVGFFKQSLDVGDIIETSANSMYLAVSKNFGMITAYGGVAKEDSSMDVAYDLEDGSGSVNFELDGVQEKRTTLGATLNLGLKLNAEMSMGNLTSYAGGVIFGF
jgi:hypothetical protein